MIMIFWLVEQIIANETPLDFFKLCLRFFFIIRDTNHNEFSSKKNFFEEKN